MRSIHTTNQNKYNNKNNTPDRVIHKHRTKLGNPIRSIIMSPSIISIIPLLSLSLFTLTLISLVPNTYATEPTASVNFSVDNNDTVLELTIPSSVNLNLTPNSTNDYTSFGTIDLDILAGTNNSTGYQLTMKADSDTLARTSSITDGNGVTTTPAISPLSLVGSTNGYSLEDYQSSTYNTYTMNTWGYKKSTNTYFLPIPTTDTELNKTSEAGNANTTKLNFAAKVDSSLPAGTYNTILSFIAIANIPPVTFNQAFSDAHIAKYNNTDYYAMQDMTSAICAAVTGPATTTEDISTQLIDTRDNKVYWVSKLLDGNCWMTQNLDLGGASGSMTLNSNDTDIADGTTYNLPAATAKVLAKFDNQVEKLLKKISSASNAFALGGAIAVVDYGEFYVLGDGTNYYSSLSDCINAGNSEKVCTHSTLGNHYGWAVATAGSNKGLTTNYANVSHSICPKNWRLPTAYDGNNIDGDFINLASAYNVGADSESILLSDPLWFIRSGLIQPGAALYVIGSNGRYWSSTVASSSKAYFLGFTDYNVNFTDFDISFGMAMRCVVR